MQTVRVRVLGGFAVEGLDEHALGSRKGRTLLKVLVLARGHAVSTELLADVLWGASPPAAPAEQVGVLVSRLRRVLGADRLRRRGAGYALDVEWLDVDELAERVGEARAALADGRLAAARAAATASVRLGSGDVLPDDDGDWVEPDRVAAAALMAEARRLLAAAAAAAGDHAAAAAAAEAALAHDPYDEASLQLLMRAHSLAGRPASGLAVYARTRERLAADLGVSPTDETEALHDQIVLGRLEAPPPTDAPDEWQAPPGRDREVEALESMLDRCVREMAAHTVLVAGEPGIGKTALVDSWLRRAAARANVMVGRCRPLGRELPLQPILDAFTDYLQSTAPDERAALLGDDADALAPLLGTGRVPPTSPTAGASLAVLDAELARTRIFTSLRNVLTRVAATRPTVLAIDDAHLAGRPSLAWIDVASQVAAPVLLVVAARSGHERLPLRATATMVLGPLDVEAVAAAVGPESAEDLHRRSGGLPLLLAALTGGAANLAIDGATSVDVAVTRRVDALSPPAAATVRAAALLGADVDLDLLAEVTRGHTITLLEHLESAVEAGMLVERGAGFAFRHELEREHLEASSSSARRALAHRDAARALARRGDADPVAVAFHARLGGDTDLAVAASTQAAHVAIERADLDSASALLDDALALRDDADVLAQRALVHVAMGRLDKARDDAERALSIARGPAVLEAAGWVAYYRREPVEARALADEAVAVSTDPSVHVSCMALAGRVRHSTGDVVGGAEQLEAAATTAAPSFATGLARVWLAHARLHQGRPTDALDALRRVPGDITHSQPFAHFHGHFARVLALGQLGRADEALVACDELDVAIGASGQLGARFVGPARNSRAWLLRWTGRSSAADATNHEAVTHAGPGGDGELGFPEAYYAGLLDLADGRLVADDADGAAALAARLAPIESWQGTMAWHQRHRYHLLRARLARLDGDVRGAADLCAAVVADATERGARRYELLARALAALVEPREVADVESLTTVVVGLGRCAILDGWPLVASLGDAFDVPAWRASAAERAAAVVAASPEPEATAAFVDRLVARPFPR